MDSKSIKGIHGVPESFFLRKAIDGRELLAGIQVHAPAYVRAGGPIFLRLLAEQYLLGERLTN
jgi:hypothetical protein